MSCQLFYRWVRCKAVYFIKAFYLVADINYMATKDRRKYPRVPICDPISYVTLDSKGNELSHNLGAVQNVSQTGINIEKLSLLRGKFYLSFAIHSSDHVLNYHRLDNWKNIWVESRREEIGFVEIPVSRDLLPIIVS